MTNIKKEKKVEPNLNSQNITGENKKKLDKITQMKLILGALLATVLVFAAIYSIATRNKEEKPKQKEENGLQMTYENDGNIVMNSLKDKDTVTITFQIKNNTTNKKNYDISLEGLENNLEDTTKLTYNLYQNNEQEIFNEIFPTEDMFIIDGNEIYANQTVEYKMIITYNNEATDNKDLGKNIRAQIKVAEEVE